MPSLQSQEIFFDLNWIALWHSLTRNSRHLPHCTHQWVVTEIIEKRGVFSWAAQDIFLHINLTYQALKSSLAER